MNEKMNYTKSIVLHWGYASMLALFTLLVSAIPNIFIPPMDNPSFLFTATYIPVLVMSTLIIIAMAGIAGLYIPIMQIIARLVDKFALFDEGIALEKMQSELKQITSRPLHQYLILGFLRVAYVSVWLTIAIVSGVVIQQLYPVTSLPTYLFSHLAISFAFTISIGLCDAFLSLFPPLFKQDKEKRKEQRAVEIAYEGNDSSEQWRVKRDGKEDFVTMDRLELIYHTLDIAKEEQQR